MSKTINLGTKSSPGSITIGESEAKPVTHYPQISIPGADCEDVPNTGTATIKFRLRRIDRGKEGAQSEYDKPNCDIEVRSITFPGKGEAGAESTAKKKAKGFTEKGLARMLAGTAADNGEPGSPSAEDEDGDEDDEDGEADGAEEANGAGG